MDVNEYSPLLQSPVVSTLEATGTIPGTLINIAKNVIGGGVLAMPYAFSGLGVSGAIISTLFLCLLTTGTIYLLALAVECIPAHKDTKVDSYSKLTRHAFGPTWCIVSDLVIACYCFGTLVGYAVFLQHFFHDTFFWVDNNIFGEDLFIDEYWFILMLVFAIEAFLLAFRDLDPLKYSSIIGTCGLCFAVGCFALQFFTAFHGTISPTVQWGFAPVTVRTVKVMPMIAFAFSMQYNCPRFYHELPNRAPGLMAKLGISSFGLCGILYMIAGFAGYFTFGQDAQSDITENYSPKDTMLTVARLGLCIEICGGIPIVNNPLRNVVITRLHTLYSRWTSKTQKPSHCYSPYSPNPHSEELPAAAANNLLTGTSSIKGFVCVPLWVYIVNMTIVGLGFVLAYYARDNLTAVLSYNTALFGTWLYFILPGLYFLSLSGSVSWLRHKDHHIIDMSEKKPRVSWWKKALAVLSVIVGLTMMCAGIVGNLVSDVDE